MPIDRFKKEIARLPQTSSPTLFDRQIAQASLDATTILFDDETISRAIHALVSRAGRTVVVSISDTGKPEQNYSTFKALERGLLYLVWSSPANQEQLIVHVLKQRRS